MAVQKKSLGEFLVEKAVITEDQLRQAKEVQKSAPGDLGNIIVDLGFASERHVTACRAQELGLPFIDLSRQKIEPDVLKLVPEHLIKRYNVIPVKKESNNRILVAVSDPKSTMVALDDIRIVSKHQPVPALATRSDIDEAIRRAFGGPDSAPSGSNGSGNGHSASGPGKTVQYSRPGAGPKPAGSNGGSAFPALIVNDQTPALVDETTGLPLSQPASQVAGAAAYSITGSTTGLSDIIQGDLLGLIDLAQDDDEDNLKEMADDAPIVRIAHTIVLQAIKEGASDIHVEPEKRGVRIRYRIDGVLNEIMAVPKHIQAPLISRFKILAEMNIAERRVPQDGRIPIRHEGKEYDLRVNCCPTNYGEKIVMRILDKSNVHFCRSINWDFTPMCSVRSMNLSSSQTECF